MASTIITPNGTKAGRRAGVPIGARPGGRGTHRPRTILRHARTVDEMVTDALRPFTLAILRLVLGVLFLWFGGLKVAGVSPVEAMVSGTLPWLDRHVAVSGLGAVEMLLGLALVTGVLLRAVLPMLVAHLAGTFLTFVMLPGWMYDDNPLLLTETGEFVVKNLVLISAALVLMTHARRGRETARGNSQDTKIDCASCSPE